MRFNSIVFFAFLAAVVVVLHLLPARWRKAWLLIASAAFYASWHPPYLALLFGVATLNHLGARWISAATERGRRGGVVIAANLTLLGIFKYLGWLESSAKGLLSLVGVSVELPVPHWVLPLGISFFLFECLSYTIDLVRKREKLHPFADFLLFVAFFPKLIAGPILRAKELLPQLANLRRPTAARVGEALWMLLSGLFLKTVVADGIAQGVDAAFARDVRTIGGLDAWVMAVGFGLQIYFDFSSYSRMAIGSAGLCGVELVENFNHPYVARSPADFWARWHMSLSRWIRDYVFFPMVGRQSTLWAMCRAALGSMILCGVWHGAGWTFVLWGAWHGAMVAGYHVVTFRSRGAPKAAAVPSWWLGLLGAAVTFGLVMLGWLWFRSADVATAAHLLGRALWPLGHLKRVLPGTLYLQVFVLTVLVWLAPAVAGAGARVAVWLQQVAWPAWAISRGLAWALLLAVSMIYLRGQTAFIYFQF